MIVRILVITAVSAVVLFMIVLLIMRYYPPVGRLPGREKQKEYAQKCRLYYDNHFHNENDYSIMTGKRSKAGERTKPEKRIPVRKIETVEHAGSDEMRVVWLGHSSALVQMGERNILLDPLLGEYCSPVAVPGMKRFSDIPLTAENMPGIDVLFISHDHYDHLDHASIKAIDSKVRHYIVPLGVDVILSGWGINEDKLHALDWWESLVLDGITYTLIPSQHSSFRNPMHAYSTLWGGIYIKNDRHSLYFTGDCGYCDVFTKVHECFGETELILADSGQYNDAWAQTHMTPEQTVQAAKDAHAGWLMPVHWGAFRLSTHPWDDPPKRALKAAAEQGVSLVLPEIGRMVNYDDIFSCTEHWWEAYR